MKRDNQLEINKKISDTLKLGHINGRYRIPLHAGTHIVTDEGRRNMSKARIRVIEKHISNSSFEELSFDLRKKIILKEQNYFCAICKLPFIWNNKELCSEYHHKDGNRKNNMRDNCECLCPNCHSQTNTDRFNGRHHTLETRLKIKKALKS